MFGTALRWTDMFLATPQLIILLAPTNYTGFTLIGANGTGGRFGAATTFAQLLGAPGTNAPESGLLPSTSPPTTFRTGAAAGNVVMTTATFNNILPDAPVASFELAVWDNSSGLYPTWTQASIAYIQGIILAGDPRSLSFRTSAVSPTQHQVLNLDCKALALESQNPPFFPCSSSASRPSSW